MNGYIARQLREIRYRIDCLSLRVRAYRGQLSRGDHLFLLAQLSVGRDVSPLDFAGDELGCAESVTNLLSQVLPFRILTGTASLDEMLRRDPRFLFSRSYLGEGGIVLSPTGSGNGKIRGHVGIFGVGEEIMSADSNTGLWTRNFTLQTWRARYEKLGELPVNFYRFK